MDEVTDAIAKLTGTLADLAQESADLKRRITEKEAPTEVARCSPQQIAQKRQSPAPGPCDEAQPVHVTPPAPCGPVREEDWQDGSKHRRRRRRGITGSGKQASASSFRAADDSIFLYDVSCDTTVDDIREYIDEMNKEQNQKIVVKGLRCASHAEAKRKSFVLTADPQTRKPCEGDGWLMQMVLHG
jgi:hypothetical protein